jgi:hypothetical protein
VSTMLSSIADPFTEEFAGQLVKGLSLTARGNCRPASPDRLVHPSGKWLPNHLTKS